MQLTQRNLINDLLINCCLTVDIIIRSSSIHKFTAEALESTHKNSSQMEAEEQLSWVVIHAVTWSNCYCLHTWKFLNCKRSEEFQVLSCWVAKLIFTLTRDFSASGNKAGEVAQLKKMTLLIFFFNSNQLFPITKQQSVLSQWIMTF